MWFQPVAEIALEAIAGFTLKVCFSGKEAVAEAVAFSTDLSLLDVIMPNMDGPNTQLELRKLPESTNTPAMFMTAKVQAQEFVHFKSLGAIGAIPKHFNQTFPREQTKTTWQLHTNTLPPTFRQTLRLSLIEVLASK